MHPLWIRRDRTPGSHIAGYAITLGSMSAHEFVGTDGGSLMEEIGIQFVSFSVSHSDPPKFIYVDILGFIIRSKEQTVKVSRGVSWGQKRQKNDANKGRFNKTIFTEIRQYDQWVRGNTRM